MMQTYVKGEDPVKNPYAQYEPGGDDPTAPKATIEIYDSVSKTLSRQSNDTHINRASAANLCVRRRWYQKEGYKGETLTPRAILNFAAGDIGEHVMKYFIQKGCVGKDRLYSEVHFGQKVGEFPVQHHIFEIHEQETLTAYLGDMEVTAHADGWGRRNSDGKWELIECKTASDYGYKDFVKDGPGNYLKQAHVLMLTDYAMEKGVKSCRFFYMKKSTGHIWDRVIHFNEDLSLEVIRDYVLASGENVPERPYKPVEETYRRRATGREVLPWQCSYCPYTSTCWPNAKKEFKSNSKPVWVVKGRIRE